MAVIGNFEGEFAGHKATSNPSYVLTKWKFPQEAYGKIHKVEEMRSPEITSILCNISEDNKVLSLKPGQRCSLLCSVNLKKENRTDDGRVYPAQVNFNILDIKVLSNA